MRIKDLNIGNNRRLCLGIVGSKTSDQELQSNPKDFPTVEQTINSSQYDYASELDTSLILHRSRELLSSTKNLNKSVVKYLLSKSSLGRRVLICTSMDNSPIKTPIRLFHVNSSKSKPYGVNSESSCSEIRRNRKKVVHKIRGYDIVSQALNNEAVHHSKTESDVYKKSMQMRFLHNNREYHMAISLLPNIFNKNLGQC